MVESEKEREKGLSRDSDENDGNEGKRNGERNERSTRKDRLKDTCGEERGRDIISEARTLIAPSFRSPAFRSPSRSLIPLVLWRSRTGILLTPFLLHVSVFWPLSRTRVQIHVRMRLRRACVRGASVSPLGIVRTPEKSLCGPAAVPPSTFHLHVPAVFLGRSLSRGRARMPCFCRRPKRDRLCNRHAGLF